MSYGHACRFGAGLVGLSPGPALAAAAAPPVAAARARSAAPRAPTDFAACSTAPYAPPRVRRRGLGRARAANAAAHSAARGAARACAGADAGAARRSSASPNLASLAGARACVSRVARSRAAPAT